MRIGSDESNISFSNINVSNLSEEKTEDTVQPDSEKSLKTAETKKASSFHRTERLNLLQGSFVHNGFDQSKYSEMNLKSLRLENSLMTNFTNVIKGVMAYRSVVTEQLIAGGKEWFVAKDMAFSDIEKIATDAPDKMFGQVTGDELKEESKEIKEDIENRTEEVIDKKQEEKQTEAKETEAEEIKTKTDISNAEADNADDKTATDNTNMKISESVSETGNPVKGAHSLTEAGNSEPIAGSVIVEAETSVLIEPAPVNTAGSVGRVVIGGKVNMLV